MGRLRGAVRRAADFADPRVYLFDLTTCGAPTGCLVERGGDVIVGLLNGIWGEVKVTG